MRTSMLSTSAALTFGALLFSTQALAADPFSVNMNYQADYADSDPIVAAVSHSDSWMAWATISADFGGGYAASNENGILGAQASAGAGSGGDGNAAARVALAVVDDGGPSLPDGPTPLQVTTMSEARWETTVTNTHGTALDYSFIFHVYGPTLQTAFDSGEAGVSLDISATTSAGFYQANAWLDSSGLSADSAFGSWSYDATDNSYYANSFDAAVSLGTIAAGASFTLTYVMSAYAFATDMEHRSFAYIGDPFDFGYGPEVQMITSTPSGGAVPEPATWALLLAGFGLVGMAVRRRRPAIA